MTDVIWGLFKADTRADMEIWVRYLNEARTFYENQVETFSPSLALSLGVCFLFFLFFFP